MANEIITLGEMTEFFREVLKCIGKGELEFKADFVLESRIIRHTISTKVRASIKSNYVAFKVDCNRGILQVQWECPRRKLVCNHIAASALYANKIGLSKTDIPNS